MAEHDRALRWAVRNRRAAAQKLLAWLGGASELELLMDSCHNYLERTKTAFCTERAAYQPLRGSGDSGVKGKPDLCVHPKE